MLDELVSGMVKRNQQQNNGVEVDFFTFINALDDQYIFYCQNPDGSYSYVSDSAVTLLGYSKNELEYCLEYLTDYAGNDKVQTYIEQGLAGEATPPFEVEIAGKDGKIHRLEVRHTPYFDSEGKVVSLYGVARSVTHEHRFQEQMAASEMMLKEAQRLARLGFLDVDHINDTVVWSDETYNIFEMESSGHDGTFEDFLKRVYAEDREKVADAYREAIENHTPYAVDYRILMSDGRLKYLHAQGETRYDRSGRALRTFGTIQDITERYALSYQLKEAQRLAKLGSWNHDLMTKRSLWSDEMYRIYEKDASEREVSYESIVNLLHPDDREEFKNAFRNAVEYKIPFEKEYRIVIPATGQVKYLHSQAETTYDNDDGRPLRIVGTTQDVTERVELQVENERKQKMLFQQSKMAQMGEMLSSIAHQWRQPLAHINSMLLEIDTAYNKGLLDQPTLMDLLDRIETVTDYLSQTIEDFRQYSHPKKEKEHFGVKELFEDALTLFEPWVSGRNITVQSELCNKCTKGATDIYGYKKELIQVMLVLLNNAKDAMQEKGVEAPLITISCDRTKEHMVIHIEDNGGGIGQEDLPKIFEPYFTTKENKEGTGMGLYLAKMMVESSMNGTLTVENSSEGAKFTIDLLVS
jgi:PAS domain S-box-containing protein